MKPIELTPREKEIMYAILAGRSRREVKERFAMSEDTFLHHLANMRSKLPLRDRLELRWMRILRGLRGPVRVGEVDYRRVVYTIAGWLTFGVLALVLYELLKH